MKDPIKKMPEMTIERTRALDDLKEKTNQYREFLSEYCSEERKPSMLEHLRGAMGQAWFSIMEND